jgi:acetylornithine deacetylase/succinyl-diaminopimelate desuccinylase-like protein
VTSKRILEGTMMNDGVARLTARSMRLLMLGALGAAASARADTFETANGLQGRWALDLSLGDSWRTRDPDPVLIGVQNGGLAAASTTDDGNLNYKKGSTFSLIGKAIGELEVKRDGFGFFGRAKAWYDYAEKRRGVPFHLLDVRDPGEPMSVAEFVREAEAAEAAIRAEGIEVRRTAIRGGTDGSALTEMGLPTPNLYAGGNEIHSVREWISVQDLAISSATVVELVKLWAEPDWRERHISSAS